MYCIFLYSIDSIAGLKTVLQNQFKKKILSKQVAKKKCIFCDKKLWIRRSKKCDPSLQAEYCECRIEKCEICVKFFKNYKYLSKHMLTHQWTTFTSWLKQLAIQTNVINKLNVCYMIFAFNLEKVLFVNSLCGINYYTSR